MQHKQDKTAIPTEQKNATQTGQTTTEEGQNCLLAGQKLQHKQDNSATQNLMGQHKQDKTAIPTGPKLQHKQDKTAIKNVFNGTKTATQTGQNYNTNATKLQNKQDKLQ